MDDWVSWLEDQLAHWLTYQSSADRTELLHG